MELEIALPYLQKPAILYYLEPVDCSPYVSIFSSKLYLTMWHVESLLDNYREKRNYTIAVLRYRLRNRHERNNFTVRKEYNNNVKRCFLRCRCRDIISRTSQKSVS